MSNQNKTHKKSVIVTVSIVAVMLIAFALISALTAGFTKWTPDAKKVNTDNFYSAATISLEDTKDGNGITLDVDENGVIKASGKYTGAGDATYTIGTVKLNEGTYTLTACDKASFAGIYVTATVDTEVTNFDFTPGNVLEISADNTVVTLKLVVAEGASLSNIKILPVISSGEDIVDFYA